MSESSSTSATTNTVLIGNNPQFHALCQLLRENHENLRRVNVCIPMTPAAPEEMVRLCESMKHNHTVQSLTVIIPDDLFLNVEDARQLGQMIAQHGFIKNLVFSNFSTRPSALDSFWNGVAQSTSLNVIAVHGVEVSQSGIAESRSIPTLQGYILDKCIFDAQGTEAFMQLLEEENSSLVMVRLDSCEISEHDKNRIATSLAENSKLPAFSLDDALEGTSADAFAEGLAKSRHLRHVEFHGCCHDALEKLTRAMASNTTIMSVDISGKKAGDSSDSSASSLNECCKHYTALNRAGRKYLREDVDRLNDETIENAWLRILSENLHDHPIVFSLLRDYTALLVVVLGLFHDELQQQPPSLNTKKRYSEEEHKEDDEVLSKRIKNSED
jgi:hypothetical protein